MAKDIGFIFMAACNDQTITDAKLRVSEAIWCGVKNIGFKDIGLAFDKLAKLTRDNHTIIKGAGVTAFLKVVFLDEQSEIYPAQAALKLKVDWLPGNTRPEWVIPVIDNASIKYAPFPGQITGHPGILLGLARHDNR